MHGGLISDKTLSFAIKFFKVMLAFVLATAGAFIGLDMSSDSFAVHVVALAILLYAIGALYTMVLLWLFGKS